MFRVKSIEELIKLTRDHKNAFLPKQFSNKWNAEAHEITGNEIAMKIKPDAFVASVGTGGSLMGIGRVLKAMYRTKIFAVEPEESQMFIRQHKKHKIQGINDGFVPEILDKKLVDEVIAVPQDKAIQKAKELARKGYLVGMSSGLNMLGAEEVKKKGFKKVVTLLPDSAMRYYSTELF